MDAIVVGIDVSKDKLDIAVRPNGEIFSTRRDAAGLAAVIARLAPLAPEAVALEATGGFVVAASLAAAGLPVVVVNRPRSAPSRRPWAGGRRPIRSMPW